MKDKPLRTFRKVHKYLGVFLALFLVMLAFTGILLNHTDSLDLSKRSIPTWLAAGYFSSAQAEVEGVEVQGQFFYALDGDLIIDHQRRAKCDNVVSASVLKQQWVILCPSELLLLNDKYELVERIGTALGLPQDVSAIASMGDQLVLKQSQGNSLFNLDTLEVKAYPSEFDGWSNPSTVPSDLLLSGVVSWQQFLLDIHSGAFGGLMGKLLADLVAIFIVGMAISGIIMWRNPR